MSDSVIHIIMFICVILEGVSIILLNLKCAALVETSNRDADAIHEIIVSVAKSMQSCSDDIDRISNAQSKEIARLNNALTPRLIRVEKDIQKLKDKEVENND